MDISVGSLLALGTVKSPGHGITGPGPAGAKGISNGFVVALMDSRQPSEVSSVDEPIPTTPTQDNSKSRDKSILDVTV
jgi:hypothetical protein